MFLSILSLRDGTKGSHCSHIDVSGRHLCHSLCYRGRIHTWRYAPSNHTKNMPPLLNFFFAALLWVQVPQWSDDWSNCAVDVPDTSCHWYVANADNTFGDGFDWETAPWYSVEGLQDIADLHDQVLADGNTYTVESLQK